MAKKLKRFHIVLDDESLLYFPGSFLTGKVLLELEDETPALGLYFHIIGEGVVRFTHHGKVVASDKENYIDFRMKLLGDTISANSNLMTADDTHGKGDNSLDNSSDHDSLTSDDQLTGHRGRRHEPKILILSAGIHTFPFKLGLPLGLPSTFLGLHGWVQYFCRAILKEPSGLVHKNQQVFIIMNPIDLNVEPSILQQPFYCEAEEKIGNNCSSSGLISCRVRLDRGGFVPGESIIISANIENASRLAIKKTRAVLAETVQYAAQSKIIQTETRELASTERGKIPPRSSDVWKKELLLIPALPPTNLRGCHLMKVQYDVFFIIVVKNRKKPIKLQLPLVMATYPIRNRDGTLKRRTNTAYPSNLPMFRPWMDTNSNTNTLK